MVAPPGAGPPACPGSPPACACSGCWPRCRRAGARPGRPAGPPTADRALLQTPRPPARRGAGARRAAPRRRPFPGTGAGGRPDRAGPCRPARPSPSPPRPEGDARRVMAPRPPRPDGRRRGVRRALRPLRRPGVPLHLLPGRAPGARRGPDQRDLPAGAAPDHVVHLAGPRLRRLARHDRAQPDRRPLQVRPLPAGGDDRRRARRPPRDPVQDGPEDAGARASPTTPARRSSSSTRSSRSASCCASCRGCRSPRPRRRMGKNEGAIKALQYRAVRPWAGCSPRTCCDEPRRAPAGSRPVTPDLPRPSRSGHFGASPRNRGTRRALVPGAVRRRQSGEEVRAVSVLPSRRNVEEFARAARPGPAAPTIPTSLRWSRSRPRSRRCPSDRGRSSAPLRQRLVAVAAVQAHRHAGTRTDRRRPRPRLGEQLEAQRRMALAAGGLAVVTALGGVAVSGSPLAAGRPVLRRQDGRRANPARHDQR